MKYSGRTIGLCMAVLAAGTVSSGMARAAEPECQTLAAVEANYAEVGRPFQAIEITDLDAVVEVMERHDAPQELIESVVEHGQYFLIGIPLGFPPGYVAVGVVGHDGCVIAGGNAQFANVAHLIPDATPPDKGI